MALYKVTAAAAVRRSGIDYAAGDEIPGLTSAEADRLVALGVATGKAVSADTVDLDRARVAELDLEAAIKAVSASDDPDLLADVINNDGRAPVVLAAFERHQLLASKPV